MHSPTGSNRLSIIAGPCVIEGEESLLRIAEKLATLSDELHIPLTFKSSYDKANRTSLNSYRGPGLEKGLQLLAKVRERVGLPITTDVHSPEEAQAAGEVVDLIQIPAFLCRQTDLLVAAAKTGKPLSIKKGQFMAPWDMGPIVDKARLSGNDQVILMDRGTTFGYNNLVCDMRAIPLMKRLGCPVYFDATHSVQLPGGQGSHSGGQAEFIPTLAKAAVAAGADGIYMECHENPAEAKSDAASQLRLSQVGPLLSDLCQLHALIDQQESHRCFAVPG